MKIKIIFLIISIVSFPIYAQPKEDIQARLLYRLKQTLDSAHAPTSRYQQLPSLYLQAIARIEQVSNLMQKDPKNEELPHLQKVCSLLTEGALLQIKTHKLQDLSFNLLHLRDSLLREQSVAQGEINKIERGYSTSLKASLEEEKAKALKMQADAENRLGALQSELIQVSKDARGIILSLSDILFDVGKATLTPGLMTSLAKIAGILIVYKDAKITVEGHTDNQGSEEFNQKLSEKRAENVANYLVEQGVIATRLKAIGYGLTKPMADNNTKEGRQKNRRVELIISDKK